MGGKFFNKAPPSFYFERKKQVLERISVFLTRSHIFIRDNAGGTKTKIWAEEPFSYMSCESIMGCCHGPVGAFASPGPSSQSSFQESGNLVLWVSGGARGVGEVGARARVLSKCFCSCDLGKLPNLPEPQFPYL